MLGNQKSGTKYLHRFHKQPTFIAHLGASNEIITLVHISDCFWRSNRKMSETKKIPISENEEFPLGKNRRIFSYKENSLGVSHFEIGVPGRSPKKG